MILIKVAFDGQSQQFRLLDPDHMYMFDDGETYLVAVDIFPSVAAEDETVEVLPQGIGHA